MPSSDEPHSAAEPPFVTKSGRVLTDADIDALVEEAERGYDVAMMSFEDDEHRRRDLNSRLRCWRPTS